jgi:hypothetical protein
MLNFLVIFHTLFFLFFISLAYSVYFRTAFRYVVKKYSTQDHSMIGVVRLS